MKAVAQVMVDMKMADSLDAVVKLKLSAAASSDAFDSAVVTLMERLRQARHRAAELDGWR